jgi:hypothetical protein
MSQLHFKYPPTLRIGNDGNPNMQSVIHAIYGIYVSTFERSVRLEPQLEDVALLRLSDSKCEK